MPSTREICRRISVYSLAELAELFGLPEGERAVQARMTRPAGPPGPAFHLTVSSGHVSVHSMGDLHRVLKLSPAESVVQASTIRQAGPPGTTFQLITETPLDQAGRHG